MRRKMALTSSGGPLTVAFRRRHPSTQWVRHWAKCSTYRPVQARRWLHGRVEQHRSSLRVGRRRESSSPVKLKAGFSCIAAALTTTRKQWSRRRQRAPIEQKTWVGLFEAVSRRILSEENGNISTLSTKRKSLKPQSPPSRRSRTSNHSWQKAILARLRRPPLKKMR